MHPLRHALVLLAAGLLVATPSTGQGVTSDEGDEAGPSPAGWDWVQASTFAERHYDTDLAASPRVVAHGTPDQPAFAALSAPWREGGDIVFELRIQAPKEGRWTERWRQELRVPWEEGGAPGAGRSSLAAHEDRILVAVAGSDRGEGKAWLIHSTVTDTRVQAEWGAPPDSIGFGRAGALEDDIAVIAGTDAIHVFHEEEGSWSLAQSIVRPPGGRFGAALSLSHGLLLAGAPAAASHGQVEVFQRTDGAFSHVATVPAPNGVTGFGEAVVTEGLQSAALARSRNADGPDDGPVLARIAPDASWTADALWPLGNAPNALEIWNGTVLVTAAGELLATPLSGGPRQFDRSSLAAEIATAEGFGHALSRQADWLVVAQAPRTLHFFAEGGPATTCPPCLCQAACDPLPPETSGLRLDPEAPAIVRPGPGVEIRYEVTAPATLVQDVHWRPDAPAGVPAAPGNERVPDMTWYLDVLVHDIVPDAEAPEMRVTLRLPYDAHRLPADLDESEVTVFFFDGMDWQDLRRVPPGSRVPATTPEGDLTVFEASSDVANDTVWATVDHTSLYAVGLSSRTLTGAPAPESMLQGPALWIGVLAFMAGSVWVSNLILSPRRQRSRSSGATQAFRPARRHPSVEEARVDPRRDGHGGHGARGAPVGHLPPAGRLEARRGAASRSRDTARGD